jgi:hypothetical protein
LAQIAQQPRSFTGSQDTLTRLERLDIIEQKEGLWQVQVELTRRWLVQQSQA